MKGSRFCLDSVASFKDINNSQTNRSKTKQTFSFNKTPRFISVEPTCPKSTYGGNKIQRKDSGAYIGYGKRSDFTIPLSVSPSMKYKIKTVFDESEMKGKTIGLGRDKVSFGCYINKDNIIVPGSTRYNYEINNQKPKAPIFSMRRKTKMTNLTMTIQPQNSNPGPGAYNNPQIDPNSSKYISRFENLSFSATKSKRFQTIDAGNPGPGNYKDLSNLSAVGKYIVSQHKGGTVAKFDKSRRVSKFDIGAKESSERPGPGNYRFPSQFGQYDGNVCFNYKTKQKIKKQ